MEESEDQRNIIHHCSVYDLHLFFEFLAYFK